ncbi:S1 family peptidase [Actinomadura sp. 9N215]|uniref:S1 family peptidase n=1 Tax=Actinomadura sp. 9N215 TaxID=3375150 RepID=UPI0037B286D6
MTTRPTRTRGAVAAMAASGLLAASLVAAPAASASPGNAAQAVRAAGAVPPPSAVPPPTAARSGVPPKISAPLKKVMAALKRDAAVPGTAWGVDPAAGQVVLTMDGTVKGAGLKKVKAAASAHGAAVRTERVPGRFRLFTLGGDPIFSKSGRCTLSFNVRKASAYYFLTAGHCVASATAWYADPGLTKLLGHSTSSSFPGDDYGLVKYASAPEDTRGGVRFGGEFYDITGVGNPTIGQVVTRVTGTTGVQTGQVTALNQTVNYPEGTVSGMIRTTLCSEPGDSGAPVFSDHLAIGLISGGSGNCSSGGTTFVQPIGEPLQAYGLEIY